MSLKLYMDEMVPSAVTNGLRLRGIDVLTAQEDGREGTNDPQLLDRASLLSRVLFTQDEDFLIEAARRQTQGEEFQGVIFARQRQVAIGQCVNDLELLAGVCEPDEFANRVQYLPLR